jgi:hypothetical protein
MHIAQGHLETVEVLAIRVYPTLEYVNPKIHE